jgi:hypothetical protein
VRVSGPAPSSSRSPDCQRAYEEIDHTLGHIPEPREPLNPGTCLPDRFLRAASGSLLFTHFTIILNKRRAVLRSLFLGGILARETSIYHRGCEGSQRCDE